MKTNKHLLLYFGCFFLFLIVAVVISCNKKFDAPPAYIPPDITANTSIAALKSMHAPGNADSITTNVIIAGVVIANDSSGNFYKQIILQDSTGGIAVNIDDYNLYSSYPIGRIVYVKLNGLYMNDDGGLMYIGTSPDAGGKLAGIPSRLKDKYVIKGELNVSVTPTDVSVQDLKNDNDKYAYMLIKLNNFEVKAADTAKTYANATAKTDASIIVKNCAGDTMVLRNSGFAYFAGIDVPNGNGSLTAVYVYYKSPYNSRITPQVMIRDTSDVQLNNARCDGSVPVPPATNGEMKSIKEIRAMYTGRDIKLGAYKIGGVVISDAANKNISSGAVVLQDGDHGISVYFGGTVTYNVGDSIVLDVTGDSLLKYNGSLEIKTKYGTTKPIAVATGINIIARALTIKQLKDNLSDNEYTLVKIKDATASGTGTYSGSQTLTDASGNVTMYTNTTALFAGSALPGDSKDWVGYGSFFNTTPQFQIRNTSDVLDGNTNPAPSGGSDLLISEYVEGSSNNKYIEIYNAGSTDADLSKYVIKLYANGHDATHGADNSARLDTISGAATLASGAVLVYSSSTATLTLPAGIVAHATKVCNFNGNDAITIEKEDVVIDVFGSVGTDPGTSWTIAGDSKGAVDKTVRRKMSVVQGNTNWTSSSGNEWIVVSTTDDVSGLGAR